MQTEWLILHGGALGDLALTLRFALRIEQVLSADRIELWSRADPGDLAQLTPNIARRSLEGIGAHWLFGAADDDPPVRLRESVAGRSILNALDGPRSRVHGRLVRLGARGVLSFDPRCDRHADDHITSQWRRRLETQRVPGWNLAFRPPDEPVYQIPIALRRRGSDRLAALGCTGSVVLIHPGSGGREKCWALGGFLEIGRRLRSAGGGVCFVLGEVELERWPPETIAAVAGGFPLIRSPAPTELFELLCGCSAFLGNDAGPTHLAALADTPTLALFGPTSATVWRPLGPRSRVLAGDVRRNAADWGIAVDDVLAALIEFLGSEREPH